MSDSKSIVKLREEYPHLDLYIHNLEAELKDYTQFSVRTSPPTKSYKELEEKLALAENSKQTAIDELYETKIGPLQNKVKDQHIQLESVYKRETRLTEEISHLKKVIDRLDTIVNYAAGYISACEQFRDKHPNYVKDWLFSGVSGIAGYKNDNLNN